MAFDETNDGAAYLSALKNSGAPQSAAAATARPPEAAHPTATLGEVAPSSSANSASLNKPSPNKPSLNKSSMDKPRLDRPSLDKRKSPRYRCKGSARIESDRGVATWATFADISMHGCYIESPAPLPVGTVLGLRLEVNGLRVEAAGEVRVAYPNLGMGISFIRISEENRERLRELVGSLLRSSVLLEPRATAGLGPIPPSEAQPAVANPGAVLQAIRSFFENRHVMGRDEFLRILQKSQ